MSKAGDLTIGNFGQDVAEAIEQLKSFGVNTIAYEESLKELQRLMKM